jgi:hypothetical protein
LVAQRPETLRESQAIYSRSKAVGNTGTFRKNRNRILEPQGLFEDLVYDRGLDSVAGVAGKESASNVSNAPVSSPSGLYPAIRNESYPVYFSLTEEAIPARYNNFYEFLTIKEKVHEMTKGFVTHPRVNGSEWTLFKSRHL